MRLAICERGLNLKLLLALAFILVFAINVFSLTPQSNKLKHNPIQIGKPVVWEKEAIVEPGKAVELDFGSENIKVLDAVSNRKVDYKVKNPGLFKRIFGSLITGFAVNAKPPGKEVLVDTSAPRKIKIIYNTEAPKAKIKENKVGNKLKKSITISSKYHYKNIISYMDIPETTSRQVKLYYLEKGLIFEKLVDITKDPRYKVKFVDKNNNGFIDRIEWITPHLSEETFVADVNLTILNIQSYPLVGGNWTVKFIVNGSANLSITAINGTSYGNELPDDLKPLELRCGNEVVNFNWTGNIVAVNNFSCNTTAYWTVHVMTEGHHYQEFNFGGIKKVARNLASNILVQVYHNSCSSGSLVTATNPANLSEILCFNVSWAPTDENQTLYISKDSNDCSSSPSSCWNYTTYNASSPINLTVNTSQLATFGNLSIMLALENNSGNTQTKLYNYLYVNHNPEITQVNITHPIYSSRNVTCNVTFDAKDNFKNSAYDEHQANITFYNNTNKISSYLVNCVGGKCNAQLPWNLFAVGDNISCRAFVIDHYGLNSSITESLNYTVQQSTVIYSPKLSYLTVGFTMKFDVTGSSSGSFTDDFSPYHIVSSNTSVCAIESQSLSSMPGNFTIRGVQPGKCNITLNDSRASLSIFEINVDFTELNLTPKDYPKILEKGSTLAMTVSKGAGSYKWESSNESICEIAGGDSSATLTGLEVGECYITVTDSAGNSVTSGLIKVKDTTAPSTTLSLNVQDNSSDQGGVLLISWSAESLEDVDSFSLYRSEVSGALGSSINTFTTSTTLYYDSGLDDSKIYYYTLKACDSSGNCINSSQVSGSPNAQPKFNSSLTKISPATLTSDKDLLIVAFVGDKDNESITMKYNCTITAFSPGGLNSQVSGEANCFYLGAGQSQYGTSFNVGTTECTINLSSTLYTKADKVSCSFIATDGIENATMLSFENPGYIYVHNLPPNVSSVNITPQNPNQSSILTCNYVFNDPDGDPEDLDNVRYKWFINNEGLNEFIEIDGVNTKTLATFFDKDDLVKCAVKVKDKDESWINEENYSNWYYSEAVKVTDNAAPQIINYNVSALPTAPALLTSGQNVTFNVMWADYENPEDKARIYVCDDSEDSFSMFSEGESFFSFGDFANNTPNEAWIYSPLRGKYVYKISLNPYKYIRNNLESFAPHTRVNNSDFDFNRTLNEFVNLSYYDENYNFMYDLGEPIVLEHNGTDFIFNKSVDEVIVGNIDLDHVSLSNFSKPPLYKYYDIKGDGFSDDDDIYQVQAITNNVTNKSIRISLVSQLSEDDYSTMFKYDIIVYEVSNIGSKEGIIIARDNDNSFYLGKDNYFTLQYNAQPLPERYLGFKICIDSNNDDVCDSDFNFMNDSVFIKASSSGTYLVNTTLGTFYDPNLKLYYGTNQDPSGCTGKTFCNTSNSDNNELSCSYIPSLEDSWNTTYKVKVCDDHNACSIYRYGNFYVNHPPKMSFVAINITNSSLVPLAGNFTTDKNLLCNVNATDEDGQNVSYEFSWYYLPKGSSTFQKMNYPSYVNYITNANTHPGEYWYCSVRPYDGFEAGVFNTSQTILISGEDNFTYRLTSIEDVSNKVLFDGSYLKLRVHWQSIFENTSVKLYLCNDPNIGITGCFNYSYAVVDFTDKNPINVSSILSNFSNGTYFYYARICSENWACSNIISGNFSVISLPQVLSININTSDDSCFTVANTAPPQVTEWKTPSVDPDADNFNITFK
jgi:hypothetical protein